MRDHGALVRVPDHADARLPFTYEAARSALAECYRIDECREWADKMAALKSYAKQSEDKSLYDTAARIQGRATRRLGELLAEIERKPGIGGGGDTRSHTTLGGRPPEVVTPPPSLPQPPPKPHILTPRQQAQQEAGLSEHQAKQAIRVAAIPEETFEAAIESPKPPTVTELAEMGKRPAPRHDLGSRSPEDFKLATEALGFLRSVGDFAERANPERIVRGCSNRERSRIQQAVPPLVGWLSELLTLAGDDE